MAKFTIVLVRHGESAWNKENRFCGWHDADLSSLGMEEAKNGARVRDFLHGMGESGCLKKANVKKTQPSKTIEVSNVMSINAKP